MLPVDLFILDSLVFPITFECFLICLLDEVHFVIFCSCR